MKTLYIVRHAKSDWNNLALSDFERTLNGRGEAEAPQIGSLLAQKGVRPDGIVASPAVRAKATALMIADKIGFDSSQIQWHDQLYLAEIEVIIALIRQQSDQWDSLMVVGHNPGLTELCYYMGVKLNELPTAGAVGLQFSVEHWHEIRQEVAQFLFFEQPLK